MIRISPLPAVTEPCVAVQLFGDFPIEPYQLKKKCCKKYKKKGKKACKSCPTH